MSQDRTSVNDRAVNRQQQSPLPIWIPQRKCCHECGMAAHRYSANNVPRPIVDMVRAFAEQLDTMSYDGAEGMLRGGSGEDPTR